METGNKRKSQPTVPSLKQFKGGSCSCKSSNILGKKGIRTLPKGEGSYEFYIQIKKTKMFDLSILKTKTFLQSYLILPS